MTYGYECEFFIAKAGRIIRKVPPRFPRDASQAQIEIRSKAYRDPEDCLESFLKEKERVSRLLAREGYVLLENKAEHRFYFQRVFAGFHLHFGCSLAEAQRYALLQELNRLFYSEIQKAKREKIETCRLKPYGFEWRSLPNTVDLNQLTQVLTQLDLTLYE